MSRIVQRLAIAVWCLFAFGAFGAFGACYLYSAWYVFRQGFTPDLGEVFQPWEVNK